MRASECEFHTPSPNHEDDEYPHIFVGTYKYPTSSRVLLDRFVEFDIQFQVYCLSPFRNIFMQKELFWNLIHSVQQTPLTIPVDESWEGLGLF